MMVINKPWMPLRSSIKYPALILTSLSGNLEDSNFDTILDMINGGFLITGQQGKIHDFSGEVQVLSEMKQIGTGV